ncbi:MAG: IS21 family transposase [Thiogranum sp.]|nr:IS21 family transposase [Thiogranum sp.]
MSSYEVNKAMLNHQRTPLEVEMIGQERWAEIRRLHDEEGQSIAAIARLLDVDRKTVRRCIRDAQWHPYQRGAPVETLLSAHGAWLRQRAPEVRYSARILYQELKARQGYRGSYETVKRFVAPLRELAGSDALTQTRFETPPGQQSQVDWGEARVALRHGPARLRIFVLTLGFSRRGYYWAYPDERLNQFLEAHERAFAHFGGLTAEHLYDRPRTVCYPTREGRVVWNTTFKAFAEHWGFEPRLCRAYRAQTKGKVESGVKYVKRNFLPGRTFVDIVDFTEQLSEWNATIADTRVHGTTHEVPLARFERERAHLLPTHRQPSFLTDARVSRIVARDWLVSFRTNRYSVPFRLIGKPVEVQAREGRVWIYHAGDLVAEHPLRTGSHELAIQPGHGPGAVARNARTRYATGPHTARIDPLALDVEVRDLDLYDTLASGLAGVQP